MLAKAFEVQKKRKQPAKSTESSDVHNFLTLVGMVVDVTFLRWFLLFCVPNANYYVPMGRTIYIFSFHAYIYAFFSCSFIILNS